MTLFVQPFPTIDGSSAKELDSQNSNFNDLKPGETYKSNIGQSAGYYPHGGCPHCGYCPTCGRSNGYGPYYPYYPYYYYMGTSNRINATSGHACRVQ